MSARASASGGSSGARASCAEGAIQVSYGIRDQGGQKLTNPPVAWITFAGCSHSGQPAANAAISSVATGGGSGNGTSCECEWSSEAPAAAPSLTAISRYPAPLEAWWLRRSPQAAT